MKHLITAVKTRLIPTEKTFYARVAMLDRIVTLTATARDSIEARAEIAREIADVDGIILVMHWQP